MRINLEMKKFCKTTLFLMLSTSSRSGSMVASPVGREILIIRHGTTEMNEALARKPWGSPNFEDPGLFDTVLSNSGKEQALELNKRLKREGFNNKIDLLCSSPLTRALQTSEIAFEGLWESSQDVPRTVIPLLRERLYLSSDVGAFKESLEAKFPLWDYSQLPANKPWWFTLNEGESYTEWRPKGRYCTVGEPEDVFRDRMKALKTWLVEREEKCIAIVCHWAVARALTGKDFRNCEMNLVPVKNLLNEPFI